MIQLAANISLLFKEVPFLERYAHAAEAGFKGVECLFPYDHSPEEIAARLQESGTTQVMFNAPPGDFAAGERGHAAIPGREAIFRSSIEQVLPYIDATGVRRIHVMAGIASAHDPLARSTYVSNLAYAARRFAERNVTLLIEPLNPRDVPGYFLADFDVAVAVIEELGADNVRLQFDIYHRQILRGDVTTGLRETFPHIGHIQIASVPTRNEPDQGELSLPHLVHTLQELVYDGWIGCEYQPRGRTEDGLAWIHAFRSAEVGRAGSDGHGR